MANKSKFQVILEELAHQIDFKVISYSGRGMYRDKCVAFVVDDRNIDIFEVATLVENALQEEDLTFHNLNVGKMRYDNMGLGVVYYWPNVKYIYDENEEK